MKVKMKTKKVSTKIENNILKILKEANNTSRIIVFLRLDIQTLKDIVLEKEKSYKSEVQAENCKRNL